MGRADRPDVILCPVCNCMACNRLHRRCRFCGVQLVYVGEPIEEGELAFVWDSDNEVWVNVDDLGEPKVGSR